MLVGKAPYINYKYKGGPKTPVDAKTQELVCLIYTSGKPIREVSDETNIAPSTVRNILKRNNLLRSIKEALENPLVKEKMSMASKGRVRGPMSQEMKEKISTRKIEAANLYAKGTRITSQGYVEYTRGETRASMSTGS